MNLFGMIVSVCSIAVTSFLFGVVIGRWSKERELPYMFNFRPSQGYVTDPTPPLGAARFNTVTDKFESWDGEKFVPMRPLGAWRPR